ncbi:MAG TPA: SDR family oxidoreductase, partial [bacterium]
FIGGHLLTRSPSQWEVWGTHLNSLGDTDTARTLRVDLRDPVALQAVMRGVKPDLVIHAAAYSRVRFCEHAPTAAWETNTWVTTSLCEICLKYKARLLFLSSDMVFDGEKGNYSESDRPNPINFYGWTKLAAERRVADLGDLAIIARTNLTYGQSRMGGMSFSQEVIETVNAGKPYYLYADQFRSFVSVQNLAACLWELAASDFSGIIHLGGSEPTDRYSFALKLAERVGLNTALLIPSSASAAGLEYGYPRNNTFDLSLASKVLKTPLLGLDEGLALEYPR